MPNNNDLKIPKRLILPRLQLMREKSVIIEKNDMGEDGQAADTIRSNRIVLPLGKEIIILRCKYMHLTVRLAAKIIDNFLRLGPFSDRHEQPEWAQFWIDAQSPYDREFHSDCWVAIYYNGDTVYTTSQSPYMDVIEKCAVLSMKEDIDDGDRYLQMTERLFAESGKHIQINHQSTVALSLKQALDNIHVGLIHRSGKRDVIFSYDVSFKERAPFVEALKLAADFIESINIRFFLDHVKEQRKINKSKVPTEILHRARQARTRREDIDRNIQIFDKLHAVRYRPERPSFGAPDDYDF